MIASASLIEHRMSAVCLGSFGVSKDFAAGRAPMQAVSDAIHRCWEDLKRDHRDIRFDDPEVSATRAVMCILYEQREPGSEDFLNSMGFSLQLLKNVEPLASQHEVLLRKHFASCLDPVD